LKTYGTISKKDFCTGTELFVLYNMAVKKLDKTIWEWNYEKEI